MNPDYDRLIDCAAIQMQDGKVWTGKRHHHCFATASQAYGEVKYARLRRMGIKQGFVTMSGRFVDRQEAAKLVMDTRQQLKDGFMPRDPTRLYSEDLY